jgi:hypothetical protein
MKVLTEFRKTFFNFRNISGCARGFRRGVSRGIVEMNRISQTSHRNSPWYGNEPGYVSSVSFSYWRSSQSFHPLEYYEWEDQEDPNEYDYDYDPIVDPDGLFK